MVALSSAAGDPTLPRLRSTAEALRKTVGRRAARVASRAVLLHTCASVCAPCAGAPGALCAHRMQARLRVPCSAQNTVLRGAVAVLGEPHHVRRRLLGRHSAARWRRRVTECATPCAGAAASRVGHARGHAASRRWPMTDTVSWCCDCCQWSRYAHCFRGGGKSCSISGGVLSTFSSMWCLVVVLRAPRPRSSPLRTFEQHFRSSWYATSAPTKLYRLASSRVLPPGAEVAAQAANAASVVC